MNLSNTTPWSPESPEHLRQAFAKQRTIAAELQTVPQENLLSVMDRLGELWQPNGTYFTQAKKLLAGHFSAIAIDAALHNLAMSLNRTMITAEMQRELGRLDLLERWQADDMGIGHVRGYPLGVVAQILAGNVFLNGVIGLAQCLLTRNAAVLKLSRQESGFTPLFFQSLQEVDTEKCIAPSVLLCQWSGQQDTFNQIVREEADAVVVWGGEAAVAAYSESKCRGKIIHYGPRLGIGFVLDGADLTTSLSALAWDVAIWEQRACSSPRILFVEDADNTGTLPRQVAAGLNDALETITATIPPLPLDLDAKAEIHSLRELAWWSDQAEIFATQHSMDHTVLLQSLPREIPVGYRTVFVVPINNVTQIPNLLKPFRTVLQTAVLAASPEHWPSAVDVLISSGITQIAAAGSASARFLGLPHEGDFALRRLITLAGIDLGIGPLTYPHRSDENTQNIATGLRDHLRPS